MTSTRSQLLEAAITFCTSFSRGKDVESILALFSTNHPVSAIEHGDPSLAPFLGRTFEGKSGIKRYFEVIGSLLSYENISFGEYVVDVEERKVAVKGKGTFTWVETGKAWDETFAYVLDFDEDAKLTRYQIWSDTGSAYLASKAPPQLEECIPSTSDNEGGNETDDSDVSGTGKPSGKYQYGSRKRLDAVVGGDSYEEDAVGAAEKPPPDAESDTAVDGGGIPSTSDNEDDNQNDSDGTNTGRPSKKFQYSWRKQLEELDRDSDEEDVATEKSPADAKDNNTSNGAFGQSSLLFDDQGNRSSQTPAPVLEDVFGNSVDRSRAGPNRIGAPTVRNKKNGGRAIVHDSDSEGEQPSSTTSPVADPAFTPASRRASTPPTSDIGMPVAKNGLKGKGKRKPSIDSRRSVPPIEFTETLSTHHDRSRSELKRKTQRVTKADKEETAKARARIAVDRKATIPRAERESKFSLSGLFTTISSTVKPDSDLKEPTSPSDDPINSFSSPEARPSSPGVSVRRTPSPLPNTARPSSRPALADPPPLDSDDDDLPATITVPTTKKPVAESSKKDELMKRKYRALEKNQSRQAGSDSDDDLEIVNAPVSGVAGRTLEVEHPSSAKKLTHTRKVQMQLAGIHPTKSQAPTSKQTKKAPPIGRSQLEQELWKRVQLAREKTIKQKQEEWQAIGGTLKETVKAEADQAEVVKNLAAKGLEAAEAQGGGTQYEDSDDESDGDWNPQERGSEEEPDPSMDVQDQVDEDVSMVSEVEDQDEVEADENDENVPKARMSRRSAKNIVDSDDENDENNPSQQVRGRRPLASLPSSSFGEDEFSMDVVHDGPTPSTDDQNDDGTDKENDTSLMFDRSDDKENKAVVRFGLSGLRRDDTLDLDLSEPRRPFQELPSPDTPKAFQPGRASLTEMFEAQLSESRRTPDLSPGPLLQPFLEGSSKKNAGGFSQFSDDEGTLLGKASSNGDLADLFDATTQKLDTKPWSTKGVLAEAFIEQPLFGPKSSGKKDDLGLTQDIVAVKSLEVKETQIRKADAVFEKEQEYLLDAAFEPKAAKEELYVNEFGFLTQTRPNVEDPEVYVPPTPTQVPSQRMAMLATPLDDRSTQRSPLATLSLTDPTQGESPVVGRLKRLRKRSVSPSDRASASLQPKKNAFDLLRTGAQQPERYKRRKLEAGDFVVDQAEESDDEGGFWGAKKKADDDEEEGGEDMDRNLETLVDDQDMDEETLAKRLVWEKYKEDEAMTDKKIEEEAQAIVKGERRVRKKHGDFLSDESDDEGENGDLARLQRKMRRQQKKREDVEALEHNPQTKSFAETYKATLFDDDNDFGHLAVDHTQSVLDQLTVPHAGEEEDDEDEEMGDEDDETQPKSLDVSEIQRILKERRATHNLAEEDGVDYHDTTWIDNEDEEDSRPLVKTVKTVQTRKANRPQRGLDPSAFDDGFEDGNLIPNKRGDGRHQQQSWAKRESRNRNTATARSVGAAAVTGLARAKTGGGSLRQVPKGAPPTTDKVKAGGIKKGASVLISKLDKSSRFTDTS
ncbi:hypothetical protein MD484_g5403, partial [Candolleomyces efflorescens]